MNIQYVKWRDIIIYKIWLCQFNVDCDIIKLIKYLLYQFATIRLIKAPTSEEINKFVNGKYINDEGIVYKTIIINIINDYQLIRTLVSHAKNKITFQYKGIGCLIGVNFPESHIKNILLKGEPVESSNFVGYYVYNNVTIITN